jgi:hypothetical protein
MAWRDKVVVIVPAGMALITIRFAGVVPAV